MALINTVSIDIPAGLSDLLGSSPAERSRRLSEAAAVTLFRSGVISSGKAAELLGIERTAFWRLLHEYGVPYFDMSADELEAELEASKLSEHHPDS
jgi:predicted HTH domain antitoxin